MKGTNNHGGGGSQLLLTEEEWTRREASEGKLLMTREEWVRRNNRGNGGNNQRSPSKEGGRLVRDKSKVRCFNCHAYGHFAADCPKPKRTREQKAEVNMAQIDDDEPALLLTEHGDKEENMMLLNEEKVTPKLNLHGCKKSGDSNVWYLDNGASNHMTGQRTKFKVLDESVTGQVKFGDGSKVEIKGKGTVNLRCKNGEVRELQEVFFIPSLCNNIISLGQLSEAGNKVV